MGNPLVSRMQGFGTTIFAEMSRAGRAHRRDQPRPGLPGHRRARARCSTPPSRRSAAGRNQYPPGPGVPELRAAIAAHQRRFYGLDVDPDREVLVTAGATEAIAAAVLALCEPGDEVVTLRAVLRLLRRHDRAGRRGAPHRRCCASPDFAVDEDVAAGGVLPRTRLVLLNTPHNPTGKVFTRAELTSICALAREHDAWVVTDEVYEHLVFDGAEHVPVATLPGMAERTLTISSAGKTFSATGWKVGWVQRPGGGGDGGARRSSSSSPTWRAARSSRRSPSALGLGDEVYAGLASSLQAKRDLLCEGLQPAGLQVSRPAGHLLRHRRRGAARGDRRRWTSAGACRRWRGGRRCRCRSSTTTSTRPARWCGSRSASATTCCTTRSADWPRSRQG